MNPYLRESLSAGSNTALNPSPMSDEKSLVGDSLIENRGSDFREDADRALGPA
jgi:hypothetical protein